ncbi:MAG: Type 1 glutamine amidotransferase-like domain-containing protein [Actinobacteria bacterium]|nr:Type 1 glutamine amidotransferase-like domain-containing protein [Actinomycetota bacterium]
MTAANAGPVALLGSGEYLSTMQAVERGLLAGRRPRMAQLATAAAPEGHERLRYWHGLGRDAADRLGVEQIVVPVVDRASAQDPRIAALIDDVGLVYLSDGNPRFLAATLRGTRVWDAIEQAWRAGTALAGCSAGAMAPTEQAIGPCGNSPPRGDGIIPQAPGCASRRPMGRAGRDRPRRPATRSADRTHHRAPRTYGVNTALTMPPVRRAKRS